MKEIKKLYRAYSVVNYLDGNPFMIWYNADNKMAGENYKDLIKDYTKMSPEEKGMAERFVDEFFTSEQIIFLNQFLKVELGTELLIEEYYLPIELQSTNKENSQIMFDCIMQVENAPDTKTINLNNHKTYGLPFTVRGIYLLNGSSNEILDRIVANKSSYNKMINADQLHEEEMEQRFLKALADGRVKLLGGASLEDALSSIAAGRVRFMVVNNPAELGIK